MSSVVIRDLAHSAGLDKRALVAIRGGQAFAPNVNVNVGVNQQIALFQQIGVNVLNNNGVIGAKFAAPDIDVAAVLWARNEAVF